MPVLFAARVLQPHGWVGPARVHVDDGIITAVEPTSPGDGARAVHSLVPGFVDLQVNGIDTVDVASARDDDWETLDRLLLAQGVTTWCPTLITMPLERFAAPLARIAEAMAQGMAIKSDIGPPASSTGVRPRT